MRNSTFRQRRSMVSSAFAKTFEIAVIMRNRSPHSTACDFWSGGGGIVTAAVPGLFLQHRGVLAGLGEMIRKRLPLVLGGGRTREAQPELPVVPGRDERVRVDTARERLRGRAVLHVNAAAVVRPEEHARAVRPVVQSVLGREPAAHALEQRHALEVRLLVPPLSFDPRALFRSDRHVILAATRGTALTVPVLEHGEGADGERHEGLPGTQSFLAYFTWKDLKNVSGKFIVRSHFLPLCGQVVDVTANDEHANHSKNLVVAIVGELDFYLSAR